MVTEHDDFPKKPLEVTIMPQTNLINNLTDVEASTEYIPVVGYTVLWRLHGLRVKHDQLKDALDRAGFLEFLPDPPTPRKSLRRALQAWVVARARSTHAQRILSQHTNPDETKRMLIRVINRAGSEHIVFALVMEDVDYRALGLNYATDLRIQLHKKTGQMICTTQTYGRIESYHESQQVAAELQPYWQEFKDLHVACDLSEMVRRIIDSLQATALRRAGGVYFVPQAKRDDLSRLRGMIAGLPHLEDQPFVCAFGVPDLQETKTQMTQVLHAGMLDEIAGLRADLRRLIAEGTNVRDETVITRLTAFQNVRAKAQVYADLLGLRLDKMRAEIGELETQARRLLLRETRPVQTEAEKSVEPQIILDEPFAIEAGDEIEKLPPLHAAV
jgi:uncharacterized protein DUF6744